MLQQILLIVHVLIAASIVGLILMQQGKGADMGAAFGSGASGTVFGSRGSSNFLTRATAILATLFFLSSLTLFVLATQTKAPTSIVDKLENTKVEKVMPGKNEANSEVPVADDKAVETAPAESTGKSVTPAKKPVQSDVPVSE